MFLKRHVTSRHGNVSMRRYDNVPRRYPWVFHLRRTCDFTESCRETTLQFPHEVLLQGSSHSIPSVKKNILFEFIFIILEEAATVKVSYLSPVYCFSAFWLTTILGLFFITFFEEFTVAMCWFFQQLFLWHYQFLNNQNVYSKV